MTEERFSCPACAKQGLVIGMWHGDQFIAETISMPVGHTSIDYDRFTCPKGTGMSAYAVTLKSRAQTKTTHMTEEEFRARLTALRRSYEATVSFRNAVQDARLREGLTLRADAISGEICALEREYRASTNTGIPAKWVRQAIVAEPSTPDQETTNPWIAYHNELIEEWFNGERALIDDLYPNKPVKVKEPVFGPLARGVRQAAGFVTFFGIVITSLFLMVWFVTTLWNLVF